ncbi:MAG: hypothetical protein DI552_11775 [Brevundimonas sp.]|uniref:DUF6894 domain-containing protein n=1 Tax=Brevundimonas albigilva TaxID=1312364 RepID=A0ABY4SI43_9CAUL|nr:MULTISPECIES: hypothetical protein [Brevundimonas]MCV0414339.1 hypothetical protein [Brevundimonas sp.]PZU55317.1 MAG: hypothetical protein DI552_11775 [Brevundimonas sp.]UQV17447.1 hypothetical protein MU852_11135 [Brevundimonas albigilva]URI14660.1 hypothetical protein M8231_12675 [Brevundimonas albigilva]
MPRYYFHTENGDRIRDDQGEELAGVEAAREEAVTVLGEILRYRGASFWDTGSFSVIVTDDGGRTVVRVTAAASEEPQQGAPASEAGR